MIDTKIDINASLSDIKQMKIYISGGITGCAGYLERFAAASKRLKDSGHIPINPAAVNGELPAETTYEQYMRMSMCMLDMADAIYMLPGWEKSIGACFEKHYAELIGKKVILNHDYNAKMNEAEGGNRKMEALKVMIDEGAYMPERAHKQDAGMDLRTPVLTVVPTKGSVIIDTGVHVQIPDGYVGMIKSKSGLNVKSDLVGEGVIDAGYTGSIVVKLYNHGEEKRVIEKGDKITQLVILPIVTPDLIRVDSLEETERGNGGFGSTGR